MLVHNNKSLFLLFGLIICISFCCTSCNDQSDSNRPQPAQPECITTEGNFPRFIELPPTGDNGSYDPTLAGDPVTGRVWMVFSRVDGAGGEGKVSTHLAYSDDHGTTWCYVNQINASEDVALNTLPQEYAFAVSAHWSHEVPSIAYDPTANASERWKMTWHRYLHVNDGNLGNDDRQFAYGWIAMKTASSPELFTQSPEIKLFSAQGDYKDQETENYNNSINGLPEIKVNDLHPELASTALLTETGMHVFNNELYLSALKGDLVNGNGIILMKRTPSGNWEYVSTLLTSTDALTLNSSWTGFSATDLFQVENKAYLLVSPVSSLYEGLALFELDLNTGLLLDSDGNGPDTLWTLPKTSGDDIFQTGVGTYDELSFNSGILSGDALADVPQFRIYATGYKPE